MFNMELLMKVLVQIIYCLTILQLCFCARNELIATADCVCPGHNFTYECSVVGGRLTVWKGTVISGRCSVIEIFLFHSEFQVPGAARDMCGNGTVVGYNVGVQSNCYTSRLDIIVNPRLNGSTVECHIDNGSISTIINTSTLFITTTPFPPPTNIRLVRAIPGELIFSWSPPPQKCPSLVFNIISNGCGTCQNKSVFSNTTCRDFTFPNTCTLTVQSIICGNLISTAESTPGPAIARLNAPDVPSVMEVYPYYYESDRRLLRLTVNFKTTQFFQIADGIDGSAISYTVTYTDSTSGSVCGSATILASSCADGMCTHLFDTSSSLCPSTANIDVTVFATNVLGNGSTSEPIFQEGINSFVDVNFNSEMKTIICIFLNLPEDTAKECSINITYGPNCGQLLGFYTNEGTGDSVSSPELPLIDGVSEYCFTVTARSSNITASVEGTLNLITINIIGIATSAAVVPVVVLFGVGALITILFLLCNYQFKQSLIIIRFSNPDIPGSLAQMLKVFKDYGVNIIRINTYWNKEDIKWNFCGKRQPKENHIYIFCSCEDKAQLNAQSKINLDFIEDDVIQDGTDNMTINSKKRACTVRVFVEDKPGAFWEVANEFGSRGINILGLNTHSNYDSTSGYKDNYVSCICSIRKQKKVKRALADAGALNVEVEYGIEPSTRTLQFYVKDELGALAGSLKAFKELNINTTGINLAYMKLPTHDIPGHETIYVECDCKEEKIDTLLDNLRLSTSGAIKVQVHNDQEVISRKQGDYQNYCIIKLSIKNEIGSLVSALEVFKDLNINIIGVNSFDTDPSIELRPKRTVEYKHIQMMIAGESDLNIPDLISELQLSGHVTDVKCNKSSDPPTEQGKVYYDVEFLAMHQVGALAKALSVFIEHNNNIISLSQERVSRDVHVQYVHNHIRFVATNQQKVALVSKMYATGLVMDVETFDHNKESHRNHSTAKGVHGNEFKQEPLMVDTQA